ncbi:MAG: hypothetical protein A2W91_10780 [Bacteroidetes bacterium GWF2_38_335]|nr:MAG: hypothetical protein A2W91_10780 [Bacteroidetes bacterium GWF2_38_335]OFY81813.1 MAG: hypothetical protein A2281_06260 [Bacteroidetes bacterium RIFOXYA12_FULL_38_20]HBS87885.1 hypothetical protein [Bacteroidales bacterium]
MLITSLMPAFSQDEEEEESLVILTKRAAQFTLLVPPLSTDLGKTRRYEYKFSFNAFIGITGGVDGFELAGFLNHNRSDMTGFQLAGFANINGGEVNGVQIAGFLNMADDGELYTQIGGFINSAGDIKGLQLSGFMGTAYDVTGLQTSGFINTARNLTGLQIGGFINVAKNVKGVQLAGFINICDSIKGVPIGFINIVGSNGYSAFEISTADLGNFFIAGKLGVKKLYNIYSIGKLNGPANRMAYGFGMGTETDLSPKVRMNFEGIVHQEVWIGEKKKDNPYSSFLLQDRLNMWNQIRLNISYDISEKVSVFAGPSYNVAISGTPATPELEESIAPSWTFKEGTTKNGNTMKYWVGFNAGLRF